jgi:hypothetical protein
LEALLSVAGGPNAVVIIDTGSKGLLVPPQAAGPNLGPPTGTGTADYGAGKATYTTYTASVDFGQGIITAPTTIGVVNSWEGGSASDFPAILGIGLNNVGPLSTTPLTALPGVLGQGVFIDARTGVLKFGDNPLEPAGVMSGTSGTLYVTVTDPGGEIRGAESETFFDSGGALGNFPATLVPNPVEWGPYQFVPAGDVISVYTADPTNGGQLLYSQTVTGSYDYDYPQVSSGPGSIVNTGIAPFTGVGGDLIGPNGESQPHGIPIYLALGPAIMTFDIPKLQS